MCGGQDGSCGPAVAEMEERLERLMVVVMGGDEGKHMAYGEWRCWINQLKMGDNGG